MITHTQKQRMPRLRSKAYKVTLPASYTEDDLGKIENWSFENCYRAAIVKTDDHHAVWVAVRVAVCGCHIYRPEMTGPEWGARGVVVCP